MLYFIFTAGYRGCGGDAGAAVDLLQPDRQAQAHPQHDQATHPLHGAQPGGGHWPLVFLNPLLLFFSRAKSQVILLKFAGAGVAGV